MSVERVEEALRERSHRIAGPEPCVREPGKVLLPDPLGPDIEDFELFLNTALTIIAGIGRGHWVDTPWFHGACDLLGKRPADFYPPRENPVDADRPREWSEASIRAIVRQELSR